MMISARGVYSAAEGFRLISARGILNSRGVHGDQGQGCILSSLGVQDDYRQRSSQQPRQRQGCSQQPRGP
jgi:hypothetical protein